MAEVKSENVQSVRFDGRVTIVTGAGRGMGREHALLLASRGAKVLVNDAGVSSFKGGSGSSGPAEDVTREIIEAGGEAAASSDTVATPEGAQAIIDAAVQKWGRIDGVLHNAGIARFGPVQDTDIQDYRDVLAVNLDAAFYLTKSAWPIMREQGFGRLLYITSAGGLIGGPGNTPYAIAKTGMLGLMNVVRFEGAPHNITVNMLGVGAQTRMVENMWDDSEVGRRMEEWSQRYFRSDLVSPVAAWLMHEDCKTTGAILNAQGGHVSRSFLAETKGYTKLDLSIEDVRDHQQEIEDQSDYRIMQNCEELQACLITDLVDAGAEPLGMDKPRFQLA